MIVSVESVQTDVDDGISKHMLDSHTRNSVSLFCRLDTESH